MAPSHPIGDAKSADLDLVGRIRAGDGAAFETLYRQHAARLCNVSSRMIGSKAEASPVPVLGVVSRIDLERAIEACLKARALEAGTISGHVRLIGTEIDRLQAKSLSGPIEFDAPLTKGGRYQFTSHSGGVRIILSGNAGFELDADTFSGSVRSDVPVTLRPIGRTGAEQGRDTRRVRPRALRGTYGDAGAFLSVRSHSGSEVISKK